VELARSHSPRAVGISLTGLGTVSILMGTVEYWKRLEALRAHEDFKTSRPAFVMALIMSAAGVFLFFGIISKLG
jgi:putative membrane protein